MGYYEQIGVENKRHRERLEKMNPIERKTRAIFGNILIWGFALLYWAATLAPIWVPIWKHFTS